MYTPEEQRELLDEKNRLVRENWRLRLALAAVRKAADEALADEPPLHKPLNHPTDNTQVF